MGLFEDLPVLRGWTWVWTSEEHTLAPGEVWEIFALGRLTPSLEVGWIREMAMTTFDPFTLFTLIFDNKITGSTPYLSWLSGYTRPSPWTIWLSRWDPILNYYVVTFAPNEPLPYHHSLIARVTAPNLNLITNAAITTDTYVWIVSMRVAVNDEAAFRQSVRELYGPRPIPALYRKILGEEVEG